MRFVVGVSLCSDGRHKISRSPTEVEITLRPQLLDIRTGDRKVLMTVEERSSKYADQKEFRLVGLPFPTDESKQNTLLARRYKWSIPRSCFISSAVNRSCNISNRWLALGNQI